ncbi:MAG TPA: hypothetical protein VGJ67_08435 [Actinomycetota bacterium]
MRAPTRFALLAIVSAALQLSGLVPAHAAAGDLDPSFGDGGIVLSSHVHLAITAIAIQPDGSIVAAGIGAKNNIIVARYDSAGTLDPSLGNGGVVRTTFVGPGSAAAVALAPDGDIVVGGRLLPAQGGPYRFAFARYLPDGSLDPTFSVDGKTTTGIHGHQAYLMDATVQPDGGIVAVGYTCCGGTSSDQRFAIVKLLPDGSLDRSFADDGRRTTPFGSGPSEATAVILEDDGRIVVGGARNDGHGAVAMYLPNGDLDRTFAGDGRASTRQRFSASGVAVDPAQDVVLSGTFFGNGNHMGAVRFGPDGTQDLSFGVDGRAITDVGPGTQGEGYGLALQDDGGIVVAGDIYSNEGFVVARWTSDGTYDRGFGQDGLATTTNLTEGQSHDIAIAPDRGIVEGGSALASSSFNDQVFALAKFQAA